MNIGKLTRMNRLFAHPSKRYLSVAVDHFLGYGIGLPEGLYQMENTLAAIMAGRPDAVSMHKGIAMSTWKPFAGEIPFILQSTYVHPEDPSCFNVVRPEEAVRLGADGIAVVAYVNGKAEVEFLRLTAEMVSEAERFDLPVICHVYPRIIKGDRVEISFEPEHIAWAVHCALETGVDIIKVPYCGDVKAYSQIIANTTVPVVAAGGPTQPTFKAALDMMSKVIESGARGATIGRNIWSHPNITAAVKAFKAVIHDGKTADEALEVAGL